MSFVISFFDVFLALFPLDVDADVDVCNDSCIVRLRKRDEIDG